MNGKYYIGARVSDFERYNDEGPVAGVRVLVDNDNAYIAGDQAGYVVEVECPYGTQEMADNLLSSLSGITYKGYRADAAVLAPEAELGDGVDVNGLYSVLAYRKVEFGPGHMSEVAAPGDNEAEHEYDYTPQSQKELDYQIAQTRSLISKTADDILLQVEAEYETKSAAAALELSVKDYADGIVATLKSSVEATYETKSDADKTEAALSSAISTVEQNAEAYADKAVATLKSSVEATYETKTASAQILLDAEAYADESVASITLSVSSSSGGSTFVLSGNGTTLSSQTLDLHVDAVNVDGKLTASQIDATNLKVAAANVTGTLTVGQLSSDVATVDDIPTKTSQLTNNSGYQTESGVTTIIEGTVTTDYVNALGISAEYLQGKYVYLLDRSGNTTGTFTCESASSYSGGKVVLESGAIEISTTDGDLYLSANGTVLQIFGGDYYADMTGDFEPARSNKWQLGESSHRWTDCCLINEPDVSSDREKKKDITYDLSDYDALFDALKPCWFRFIENAHERKHTGLISQDVEDALAACGLTGMDFAGFIKSERKDEERNVIEGEYDYSLRYGEFISLLIDQVQKLKARVAALEGGTA